MKRFRILAVWCTLSLAVNSHAQVKAEGGGAADQAHRVGTFKTSFSTPGTFTTPDQMKRRLNESEGPYNLAEASYEVFVPDDYSPSIPIGLFVWINSGDGGGIPKDWRPLLAKYKFICIGANNSGNSHSVFKRIGLAVDAVEHLKKHYNIDPNRVYLSGNSGGGRAASRGAIGFADVFLGGACYVIGCDFWEPLPAGNGKFYPGFLDKGDRGMIAKARHHRFVFLTGSKDFNKHGTLGAYNAYKAQGFKDCLYLEVPDMGHSTPPPDWIEKALVFFNEPLKKQADAFFNDGQNWERRSLWPKAIESYGKAEAYGSEEAAERMTTIKRLVDEATAKGEACMKEKDYYQAYLCLNQAVQVYGKDLASKAAGYIEQFKTQPEASAEINAAMQMSRLKAMHKAGKKAEAMAGLKTLVEKFPDTRAAEEARAVLNK